MSLQTQHDGGVEELQHPMLTPDDYIVNDATLIPCAIYDTLRCLSQDTDVMGASEMIQRNPYGSMNAAARFERLLANAEQWINGRLSSLSVFEKACIWHGLVDYRRRLAGLELSDPQSLSTSPQQNIIAEYYVPWHAPKPTSDDSIWPADSLVGNLKLRANLQALFESTKRFQDQLTPLAVHTLPYLMNQNVMVCSGSHFEKTLALAIGVVDFVVRFSQSPSSRIAPKALIVLPSNHYFFELHYYLVELAQRKHDLRIKIGGISTWENTVCREVDSLTTGIDIMLATPGKLERADSHGRIDWSRLMLVAIHEFEEMALDFSHYLPPSILDPVHGSIGKTARACGTHYKLLVTSDRGSNHGALITAMQSLMLTPAPLYHISAGCPAHDIPNITYRFHKTYNTTVSHLAREAYDIIQQHHDGATATILWATSERAAAAHSLYKATLPPTDLWLAHAEMQDNDKATALQDFRRHAANRGGCVLNTTVDCASELRGKSNYLIVHADLPSTAASSDLYPAWYEWFETSISAGKTPPGMLRTYCTLVPEAEQDMAWGMAQVLRDYRKEVPGVLAEIAGL
ncbi:DEAD-box ATP-dependent RNA helicase 37 [Lasiodiplodia hormozganensis]|uniref:DEAD-box ATP-dependent RNA helicase 37 n=1 Tax=Lasiodiplodia hormozganensis TaxID=869390 RepID=A0AA40CQA7_9PEZI|nr:DEAD-box ATP-dependent RNA helicase 37 [Lasiodiplodia hormozganensis]